MRTAWSLARDGSGGEAIEGYSLIGGNEQLVFLGVLVVAMGFEGAWYLLRGTNAVVPRSRR
jgi:hypothetical protein